MDTPLTDEQRKMVEDNLGLAYAIARDMTQCKLDINDRRQAGVTGLIRAVQKYDPASGAKLSTYSRKWIISYIRQAEESQKDIRVPTRYLFDYKDARSVRLKEDFGALAESARKVSSLDEKAYDAIRFSQDQSEQMIAKERAAAVREAVEEAIASLEGDGRTMVELRLFDDESYKRIGERFGMSANSAAIIVKSLLLSIQNHPAIRRVA